jgi:RND superfamily putative drug exporter
LRLHLGTADASTDPRGSTTKVAYDLIRHGFGPGAVGPVVITAQVPHGQLGSLAALESAVRQHAGVVSVSPPVFSPDRTAAVITAIPATGPADRATASLISQLRHETPAADDGLIVHVGGETANNVDFAHVTSQRLPLLILGVLAISFLLLLVGFRSVVVAAQAVVFNLLSVGAAYGIVVAVFGWGWGAGLLGATAAPIAPWIPTMLFAITFGLSMDYEVFLVSAVREAAAADPHDSRAAVARGLGSTAGVITAAAAIMALVFASFITSSALNLKVIGLGLAAAIVVDATIIRLLVVPATLTLLGSATWWLPRRLQRVLPQVDIEPRQPVGPGVR